MIYQFQKRGYDRSLIQQQINKANLQKRETKETAINIPLLLKYNRTLPKKKRCYKTLATSGYKPKPS